MWMQGGNSLPWVLGVPPNILFAPFAAAGDELRVDVSKRLLTSKKNVMSNVADK